MQGVLKFLCTSPQRKVSSEKRCFPERSFGVSKEAPQEFQTKNTLINPEGYIWTESATQPLLSHTRYVSVVGDGHAINTFKEEHEKRLSSDKSTFRRRKGLLGEFMDKHGWQSEVTKLMGFQRSDKTRQLNNIEVARVKLRAKQLSERKSRSTYHEPIQHSQYCQSMPALLDEKNRIRKRRNRIYEEEIEIISRQRKFKPMLRPSSIDRFMEIRKDHVPFLRLHCPQDNESRPSSQTHRTFNSLLHNTARARFHDRAKFRSTFELDKCKHAGSTMCEFNDKQLQQFDGRLAKEEELRMSRSGYDSKLNSDG